MSLINEVNLVQANSSDLDRLRPTCISLYTLFFGGYWEQQGLQKYLDTQFGLSQMTRDLSSPDIRYYLIAFQNQDVGFIKVNLNATLEGLSSNTCELEKMYINTEKKGLGIGQCVFNLLCAKLRLAGKSSIFCGVLDTNKAAIGFYNKVGFRYHSHIKLDLEGFKTGLNGLNWMVIDI